MSEATRWSDLKTRTISAVSLLLMAIGAALYGRLGLAIFTAAILACMAWELARMHQPKVAAVPWVAGLAAGVLTLGFGVFVVSIGAMPAILVALLIIVALSLGVGRDHAVFALYFLAMLIAGQVVVFLYQGPLLHLLGLLIGVVIASDVFGYLVGRVVGGPKFWPRISPKKTWSGIIAGWVAAGLCGLGLSFYVGNAALLVPLAVAMALASQLGDIAESAIKRRAGVKDASELIPGHGGVLDRFDGTVGAALIIFALLLGDVLL